MKLFNNKGYTLIELIIYLSIISIISINLFTNLDSFEKKRVYNEAYKIKSIVEKAQLDALTLSTNIYLKFYTNTNKYHIKYDENQLYSYFYMDNSLQFTQAGIEIKYNTNGTFSGSHTLKISSKKYFITITFNVSSGNVNIKEIEKIKF